jgi:hypothetical protein
MDSIVTTGGYYRTALYGILEYLLIIPGNTDQGLRDHLFSPVYAAMN